MNKATPRPPTSAGKQSIQGHHGGIGALGGAGHPWMPLRPSGQSSGTAGTPCPSRCSSGDETAPGSGSTRPAPPRDGLRASRAGHVVGRDARVGSDLAVGEMTVDEGAGLRERMQSRVSSWVTHRRCATPARASWAAPSSMVMDCWSSRGRSDSSSQATLAPANITMSSTKTKNKRVRNPSWSVGRFRASSSVGSGVAPVGLIRRAWVRRRRRTCSQPRGWSECSPRPHRASGAAA